MSKRDLRRRMRAMLAALPEEFVDGWSRAIGARLTALDEWRRAGSLHTYIGSLPGEVRTERIVAAALAERKSVLCPRIRPHGQLDHHELTSLSELRAGAFGVREPDPELAPPADARAADLIIVPGLAVGLDGSRLGNGGGYYDRFLSGRRGTRAMLAFEAQLAPTVPQAAHDEAVDLIVTELRVIRCR